MRFMYIVTSPKGHIMPTPALMEAIGKISEREVKAGRMIDNGGLMPVATGAQVKISDKKLSVIDGPFVEAKEVIGGYWMIQVRSREEAIEWARRAPMVNNEVIEVRQIQELGEFPEDVRKAAAGFEDLASTHAARQ